MALHNFDLLTGGASQQKIVQHLMTTADLIVFALPSV